MLIKTLDIMEMLESEGCDEETIDTAVDLILQIFMGEIDKADLICKRKKITLRRKPREGVEIITT